MKLLTLKACSSRHTGEVSSSRKLEINPAKLFSCYPAGVRTVGTCGRLGNLPQHFPRSDFSELRIFFFLPSSSECASEMVTHSKPEQVALKVMRQEGEQGGFFGCVSHNCLQETTETCPSLGDVQSQHTLLAKWFLPVLQFCMSSNRELSSLPQPVQGESWELSQSVCKFMSCPGIDCLALVCFKMLLMNKQRLMDSGAAGTSSPSSALSYIPQQGHGSSCPDWLKIECVLSDKCDNPRCFLPPLSGEPFVESGLKILHIWDPLHAVSTWKICIIFNLMGEFKLLQLSQCSCTWNVCKQIW